MTRRLSPASRVCIGVLLLLLSDVIANTTRIPTTVLVAQSDQSAAANGTSPNKVAASTRDDELPSSNESEDSSRSVEESGEWAEKIHRNYGGAERTNSDREKGAPALSSGVTGDSGSSSGNGTHQGRDLARSNDDAERSSSSDPAAKRSRFGEILRESSGKSSSTKAISDEFSRVSRTNALNTATSKPGLDDAGPGRHEEKRNKSSVLPSLELEGEYDEADVRKRISRDREQFTSVEDRNVVDERKRNQEDFTGKSEQSDLVNTGVSKEREDDGAVSLANDTQINDDQYHRTSKDRDHESSGSTNRSGDGSLNKTNFIPGNGKQNPKEQFEVIGNSTHTPTLRIVTAVDGDQNSGGSSSSKESGEDASNESPGTSDGEGSSGAEKRKKKGVSEGNDEQSRRESLVAGVYNGTGGASSANGASEKREKLSNERGQVSFQETSTRGQMSVVAERQVPTIGSGNPSQVGPRGRTIAFSGVNEFPSVDTKTTLASGKEVVDNGYEKNPELLVSKKSTNAEKLIDQKPYPYVKSGKDVQSDMESRASHIVHNEVTTTEETSAYENTIGRSQSDKKFVVTEPSVVIENSIQQFKPTYYKRSGNDSNNSTTESQVSLSVTASSLTVLDDVGPTNGTLGARGKQHESESNGEKAEDQRTKTSSAENDVPRGDEVDREKITGRDESFDVTGNGITEVSSTRPAEGSPDVLNKETAYGSSFLPERNASGTTEVPLTASSTEKQLEAQSEVVSTNVDVQTDAEESLLIRSTLNVTEVSTEYPLSKGNSSEKYTIASSTSSSANSVEGVTMIPITSFTVNVTTSSSIEITTAEPSRTSETNETIDSTLSMVNATTPTPNETFAQTTTSVEYEFVGLTDTTLPSPRNATTESQPPSSTISDEAINATTSSSSIPVPTFQALTTKEYPSTTSDSSKSTSEDVTTNFPETSEMDSTTIPTTDYGTFPTTPSVERTGHSILDNETTTHDSSSISPITPSDHSTGRASSTGDEDKRITSETSSTDSSDVYVTDVETTDASSSEISSSSPITSESPRVWSASGVITPSTSSSSTVSSSVTTSRVTDPSTPATTTSTTTSTMTPEATKEPPAPSTSTLSSFVPSTIGSRVIPSTWSTPSASADVPTERTTEVTQTLSPDEFKQLVKIVVEGTWKVVCPHLSCLRQRLAEILTARMERPVSEKQIMFHQSPCPDAPSPAPTLSDITLTTILVYVVDEDGKFDAAMTKILPSLYDPSINFPLTIHSFRLVQETDSGNAIAVVIVSSVAFICLVLLAGLLFIMRKRQTRFNYGERCRPVSLDAYSLDSVSAYNSVRRKGAARASKRSYGNPTFEDSSAIPSHPLNFAGLSSFCNDVNAINEEFSGIPQVSAKIDELPVGAEVKNRYANVIPLPETRVPLQRLNNDPLTEYINASYVRGPKNATKYYIACQAPIESTVTDFWRMIWEQQSKVMIMLTDLVENGVEKCTEYIPPSEVTDCHRLYGDFQVTLKKRETKEKYAISTLHLKNLENNTFREVFHIWYLWPVNGVQSDGAGLIAVLLEARALQRGGPGPIVVHCSPGTGRTGTLIALDLGIRQYEITRTVDVPRVVYTIRRDRAGAVQTKEQYAFIYKALNLYATKLAGGVLEST